MKLNDWNNIYNNVTRWAISRMSTTSFFEDSKDDWIESLIWLEKFEKELFDKYHKEYKSKFTMRCREWSQLCHKYIHRARKINNRTIGTFFFEIWSSGRHCWKSFISNTTNPFNYTRQATKEEIEYANKYLVPKYANKEVFKNDKTVWYRDDTKVLTYRGINAIIDSVFCDAHILYRNKHHTFQLIYDWYYPIDEFLDLEKMWKPLKEEFSEECDEIYKAVKDYIVISRKDVKIAWERFSTDCYCAEFLVVTDYYIREFIKWYKGEINK